jgi:O-antigen polymerase
MKAEKVYIIPLILTTGLLFLSPLAISNLLFDGLITSKIRAVEMVALPVAVLTAVGLMLKSRIRITAADILVLTFLAWCALSEVFIHNRIENFSLFGVYRYILWAAIWLSVRIISVSRIALTAIPVLWMTVTLIIAIMGLMQLYGMIPSKHNLFSITGPFHNPGPFSGWIVAALPLSISYAIGLYGNKPETEAEFRIIKLWKKEIRISVSPNWYIRYIVLTISVVTMAAIVLVLPPAASRASWIAGAIAAITVIIYHNSLRDWRNSVRMKIKALSAYTKTLVVAGMLVLILTAGFGLYILKKESVDGRLLVWKVTATLIGEKPLTGHGADSFTRDYMQAQAEWFSSGRGTPAEIDRAGSPNYVFNELLELWLSKGFIAVALAFLCIFMLLHPKWTFTPVPTPQIIEDIASQPSKKTDFNDRITEASITGLKGALIAILTFSLFSYPFSLAPFILQVVSTTALLAACSKQIFVKRGIVKTVIVLPVAITILMMPFGFFQQRKELYNAMKEWREAHRLYTMQAYDASVLAYDRALPALSEHGLFLQMYGKALSQAGAFSKSNEMLDMSGNYFSSQIISLTRGDNYRALGNVRQSEEAYLNAINMMPGMLYPRYQLFKLYAESAQNERSAEVAAEILSMSVRIESSATRQIIEEVQTILQNLN